MARTNTIAVVDYGAGNIRSVMKALEYVGHRPELATTPFALQQARAIIFPGQGASPAAMAALRQRGLLEPIREAVLSGRPFLGICLGLQLLMDSSEEGNRECLGLVPGRVRRLPSTVKIPHMGWNKVRFVRDHPLLEGIPQNSYFYFAHSYYVELDNPALASGHTEYGIPFCSLVIRNNVVAMQFHPEKSGHWGLKIYENFINSLP